MVKLDDVDMSILQLLQDNGKRSYTDIAKRINVSEGTVRTRINRMLKERVFEFIIHMDPNKIGLNVQAIIGIKTQLGKQETIATKLNEYPEVRFVGAFSGRHDLILQAYFKNNEDLVNFVNKELSKIDGILAADVSIELKQYKDSFSYINNQE
ncbi:Lrp/AsnC family transcriptional regulator [Halalkalibacterium halodurans]|uniref:Transcriptional regulator n=2 Tax=Halalkalibacterium halodurans TaxID=86665 RepID=Q9K6T5_HALH5|nr:Lrp/AsnC family transcriptional regulator [Halalkalibacterium halodurans]MED3645241.1 Lrp/AsnC family transcriptional regulator [Halalkalibacterium halodurans]MED4081951.1 Lrp/AsnC family transcriptional regulator [Halalkalibacterium halodurans]MED4083668.1 Lrp/AsnC family transcriptional regulator [Halalkalibacterium halodurans]MED4106430.1 Lrp/AsnC family transcriptional regulator [Halalkalibacterium halodurans]MED4107841.1 Lrp/AsnC family transcriptional regulator [Halalkalibacterium hal